MPWAVEGFAVPPIPSVGHGRPVSIAEFHEYVAGLVVFGDDVALLFRQPDVVVRIDENSVRFAEEELWCDAQCEAVSPTSH